MVKFKNIIIVILYILISHKNNAQTPYELFNSRSEYFYDGLYTNVGYTLKGLCPDSVKYSLGDSVYYHYRIYKDFGTCKKFNYPSWLGIKTVRKSNEDYLFFNKTNDTILIKSGAQVGANWIYFKFSNGNYLRATLSSKNYTTIYNGLNDTVKTVTFQCFNALNNPIYHPYNTKTIKIARDAGLISSGNFYDFPADTNFANRSEGKHLTNKDVFDNSIGDIIQVRHSYSNYQPPPNNIANTYYTTDTIASKIYITSDSVHITNTIGQTRRHGRLNKYAVDQMPEQALITNWMAGFSEIREVHYKLDTSGNCRKTIVYYITDYCNNFTSSTTDTCFSVSSVSCINYGLVQFREGSGNLIDELFMGIGVPRTGRKVTFTRLNNIMCGNFYSLGIEVNDLPSGFSIYPNPSSDYILIKNESHLQYKVIATDVLGKEHINDFFTTGQKIDVQSLEAGLYFLRIETENSHHIFKLIKQ